MFMISLLFVPNLALAGDGKPDEKPEVDVGGVVIAHYELDLTDGADSFNEFAIDRAYVTAKAKISKHFGAKVTLDVDRGALANAGLEGDTKYRVFLKHAYLEWKDFAPGMKVRAGMIDTPYQPYYDQFWEHRYVAKGLSDEVGTMSTADLGVSIGGNHAKGLVDWTAGIYNGEGYTKVEVDSGKSVEARVTIDPLARGEKHSMPLTAFVDFHNNQGGDPTITYVGAAGFKMPFVWFWGEYTGVSEGDVSGSGYSVSALPGMPRYARLIVRYDHFDPNSDRDDDGVTKIIGGVSRNFYERVSLAATYERTTLEAAPDAPSHGAFLHMQAGF